MSVTVITGQIGKQNVLWLSHLLLHSKFMKRTTLNLMSEYNDFKEAGFPPPLFFFFPLRAKFSGFRLICCVICCSLVKAWLDVDLYRVSSTAVFKQKIN